MQLSKSSLLPIAAFSLSVLIAPLAGAQTTVTTTTSAGTVSEFSPDTLVIRSETSPTPVRYSYTGSTTYVDETGAPVSRELVRSGLPVTVHYVQEGDRMIANRVVVRRQTTTTTAPTVIERNTTVTTPPVVVEKPVIVEKPVVVERPVVTQPPVLIEKNTSTTTTTRSRDDD